MDNKIASNVFGIGGTILWAIELIPQIRLNHIRRSTEGVSLFCFVCWYLSGIILTTYLVYKEISPGLIIQTASVSFFDMVILFQHFYFDRKTKPLRLFFAAVIVTVLSLGFTIGQYYLMVKLSGPVVDIVFSVLSAVLLLMGYLPQIYEIYITKNNPKAISKLFVFLDFGGGTCGVLSLVFIVPFEWLSFACYVIVPACQIVQFSLIVYYNRLVQTGQIVYHDEEFQNKERKLSIWKRTHRATNTRKIEMSNKKELTPEP